MQVVDTLYKSCDLKGRREMRWFAREGGACAWRQRESKLSGAFL